jgi:hypothetical protein
MDYNLYFQAAKEPVLFNELDLPAWQALGYDRHSLVADPLFLDPDRHDFRLHSTSLSFRLGYHAVDFSQAGVHGSATWQELARSLANPEAPNWIVTGPSTEAGMK